MGDPSVGIGGPMVNAIKAGLAGIGTAAAAKTSNTREMNRNFADHGVTP